LSDLVEYLRSLDEHSLVVGVGNPLRGDDGLGPELVRRMTGRASFPLIDAGEVPEDFLEPIVGRRPQRLLIVDAVNLGAAPGDAALLQPGQLASRAPVSTHTAPLHLFIRYLEERLPGLDLRILGVQPRSTGFGQPLSPEVERTLESIAGILCDARPSPPDTL
jgi:hydrogenase 3 maturation protease